MWNFVLRKSNGFDDGTSSCSTTARSTSLKAQAADFELADAVRAINNLVKA